MAASRKKAGKPTEKQRPAKGGNRVTSPDALLLAYLQEMDEALLTTTVVTPLFIALGYKRVDYYGGPYEDGKDLICSSVDAFGETEVTAIQIKRFRPSARARDEASFSEIVAQLSQSIEKRIPMLDGTSNVPDRVVFITPFPIDTRSLQSRFEAVASLRARGARIIDGIKLVEQIKQRLPSLMLKLGASTSSWREQIQMDLSNDPLMNALDAKNRRAIGEFYTDIDFSLGRNSTVWFFGASFTGRLLPLMLRDVEWKALKLVTGHCRDELKLLVLSESEDVIEARHLPATRKYAAWLHDTNQLRQQKTTSSAKLRKIETEIQQCSEHLRELWNKRWPGINAIESSIGKFQKSINLSRHRLTQCQVGSDRYQELEGDVARNEAARNGEQVKLRRLRKYDERTFKLFAQHLAAYYEDVIVNRRDSGESRSKLDEFVDLSARDLRAVGVDVNRGKDFCKAAADSYVSAVDAMREADERIAGSSGFLEEPLVQLEIDGEAIAKYLRDKRDWLKGRIQQFNLKSPDANSLAVFLDEFSRITRDVEILFSNPGIVESIGLEGFSTTGSGSSDTRPSISIHKVFDSGMNLLVLGEAGSGKTTSLQMYYKRMACNEESRFSLYIPLGRMASGFSKSEGRLLGGKSAPPLERLIAKYLESRGIAITEVEFVNLLSRRATTLLLDGIDEAVRNAPWIADAISALSSRYEQLQIVTSSRRSGPYVAACPFCTVHLLPFTPEQQSLFFKLWFTQDRKKSRQITKHLAKNSKLAAVVSNPLLATVLCVLAEHKVHLPDTEPKLYEERMKLLTGYYDAHKGIERRVETRSDDLIGISRQIAFALHSANITDADLKDLYDAAANYSKDVSLAASRQAVDELIDPCNVLVPTNGGQYGFGHLRYQEYLVAEMFSRDRSIEIEEYFGLPWWDDVFLLYARMSKNLEGLIQWMAEHVVGSAAKRTIESMIGVLPEERRRELQSFFKLHQKADLRESAILTALGDPDADDVF